MLPNFCMFLLFVLYFSICTFMWILFLNKTSGKSWRIRILFIFNNYINYSYVFIHINTNWLFSWSRIEIEIWENLLNFLVATDALINCWWNWQYYFLYWNMLFHIICIYTLLYKQTTVLYKIKLFWNHHDRYCLLSEPFDPRTKEDSFSRVNMKNKKKTNNTPHKAKFKPGSKKRENKCIVTFDDNSRQ